MALENFRIAQIQNFSQTIFTRNSKSSIRRQNFSLAQIDGICRRHYFDVARLAQAFFDRIENIVGKEKDSRYKHFLFLNSLRNDKFFDWSKLKTIADDKINVTEKLKCVLRKIEKTVGKGENAGYQHFPLFLQSFSIGFSGALTLSQPDK